MSIDPVVGTLSGVLGGAAIGFLGNWILSERKRRWDKEDSSIKRAAELEDREYHDQKEKKIQKFESYNKILKVSGETIVVSDAGGGLNFSFDVYSATVRPFLFDKFHLLDKDVRENVRSMDEVISRTDFNQDATDDDHDEIAGEYLGLIKLIEAKYISE